MELPATNPVSPTVKLNPRELEPSLRAELDSPIDVPELPAAGPVIPEEPAVEAVAL